MSDRRDYLAVCNDRGVPLPDFQAEFCVRCIQPECSRSKAGGAFDSRVATWRDRLFVNPPRMPKDDPLYAVIASKMFRDIEVGGRVPEIGRAPAVSAWVDPLTLEEPRNDPKPTPRAAAPVPIAEPSLVDVSVAAVPRTEGVRPKALVNTPFVQGTMIGAAPPPKPAADPWAASAATPQIPEGKVVSRGARIRFRGGGG